MKRILHVVGRMDRGGTESMLMTYYRHIDRKRLQFDFVVHSTENSDFENEILDLGGKILRVPRFNVLNLLQYKQAWNNLFENNPEYDVIHVHHFLVAGIILPIAQKHHLSIRIVHSHNTKPPIFILKEKVMWLFSKNMIKSATKRLACSQEAGKYLFGNYTFDVFYNAIEARKYQFCNLSRELIRKEFGLSDDTFVLGHIGSFRSKQKNHTFLIEVFSEIVKRIPNSTLLLIGIGELQIEIKNYVAKKGLKDNVIFTGLREDIPAILSSMDVFVLPSFFEGFGIVGVEAQASGLPCIVSSAVPQEACVSELFIQIPLSETSSFWASKIMSAPTTLNRQKYINNVISAGYDIESNIERLYDIYDI